MRRFVFQSAQIDAHYVPAPSIYLPPRQRATFHMQPLHKRVEAQNNSFSFHFFEQCYPSAEYFLCRYNHILQVNNVLRFYRNNQFFKKIIDSKQLTGYYHVHRQVTAINSRSVRYD